MPPLIALALVGAGLYVAGRFVKTEMARVAEVLARNEAKPKPIEIRLDRDPGTGVYRYKGPGEV
ncbi:hypothetical protein [Oharaeibacter diazotrophicus]|uniref:Uncharacterized protein n=1 Tax=Oharaeibacter diazotrophicus TaxID=1920512 RepID=A0A4R6RLX3_9HYPH|nr:hypothetical protein [Oharaeibacter diazotrophicus]TDP87125.1 hypothetical protein EDD54_1011 [Oharaeibacter diazotrophicus]BBE70932.1 hypothetical protein OHA_1_00501 [Pleomorphomonas sp. SM30]GLS77681.1 hypothetical protein GCM10007904_30180 [Oharaeibacter diazotrophicus]